MCNLCTKKAQKKLIPFTKIIPYSINVNNCVFIFIAVSSIFLASIEWHDNCGMSCFAGPARTTWWRWNTRTSRKTGRPRRARTTRTTGTKRATGKTREEEREREGERSEEKRGREGERERGREGVGREGERGERDKWEEGGNEQAKGEHEKRREYVGRMYDDHSCRKSNIHTLTHDTLGRCRSTRSSRWSRSFWWAWHRRQPRPSWSTRY